MCVCCRLENEVYVLRVGESEVTTLLVELYNAGEDAHDTTLTVILPDIDVDYLGTDSHVSCCIATPNSILAPPLCIRIAIFTVM